MKLTALAVDHLDLLHALGDDPEATYPELGQRTGRSDPDNVRKTVLKFRDEGLVEADGKALTEAGRALTRLISAGGDVLADHATLLLTHDVLDPDPANPRTNPDPAGLDELRLSIVQRSTPARVGLKHAISVKPSATPGRWQMHGGGRRWRAIGAAIARSELPPDAPIPCTRWDQLSEADAALDAIMENVHSEHLHPLDEGDGYARLIRDHVLSLDRIAAGVGRSRKHVADRVALVEKLGDDAKRRMRLPEDYDDHLTYAAARKIVQGMNARPKPAVDVSAKEALTLIEVAALVKAAPSHDPLNHGKQGWSRVPAAPAGGAGPSLVAKGLIEIEAYGDRAYVRLAPARASEILHWIADKGAMALWSARAEVLGSGMAAELETHGRYATPWLNDTLDELHAETAPPPPLIPAKAGTQAGAGKIDHQEHEEHQGLGDLGGDPTSPADDEPPTPPYLQALAGIPPERRSGADHSSPVAQTTGEVARDSATDGAQPAPAAPAPGADLVLTDAQALILAEVAAKTAAAPLGGRAGPDGKPAFVGCAVTRDYYKHGAALALVTELRLLAFVPSARDVQMCVLQPRARAWLEAHPQRPRNPPYATPWLNPDPPADRSSPVAKTTGEVSGASLTEGAQGRAPASGARTFLALPCVLLTEGVTCGNCEQSFELSSDFDDEATFADGLDHRFVSQEPGEACTCPHCNAPLAICRVEVRLIDPREAS